MFFRLNIHRVFPVLVFMGFSGYCSLAISSESEEDGLVVVHSLPSELNRVEHKNRIIEQYSDNLRLRGCHHTYNLNFPIDRELSDDAEAYSTWDVGNSQFGKSHLLANGFDIYENDEDVVFEYERFTTKTFSEIGIGSKGTNIPIDWMSYESILKSDENIFRRRSGHSHSEPQLIDDIELLWKTKPDQAVKLFTPRVSKLKDPSIKVLMTGLELYGSFDNICNSCLGKLVDFRRKHQSGQQSISGCIRDTLKGKYADIAQNRFVVIYHTNIPYSDKGATSYHTKFKGADYMLGCGSEVMFNSKKKKTYKYNAFSVKHKGQLLKNIPDLEDAALSQATEVETEQDVIYIQMHPLYGKKAKYKKPLYNDYFQFIFDGQ